MASFPSTASGPKTSVTRVTTGPRVARGMLGGGKKLGKRGNIDEVPADIRWKYYSTFTKVATRYRTPPAELEGLDNMWIMGPSGTGKSYFVHRTFPGAYKKDFNRWWDNFEVDNDAHQTVILDDLHFKWAEKERLKNWADVYPFMAEFKGGSMMIRPKRIVVTSNFHPQQV